jgi:6-phosphofructokinase
MNAALRAVVRSAIAKGLEVSRFMKATGLDRVAENASKMAWDSVGGSCKGGTVIGTARSDVPYREGRLVAARIWWN